MTGALYKDILISWLYMTCACDIKHAWLKKESSKPLQYLAWANPSAVRVIRQV